MIRRVLWLDTEHPMQLALGLTIWSLWFVTVYGGLSVVCAVSPPAPEEGAFTGLNLVLGGLTLLTLGFLAWLTQRCVAAARRKRGRLRYMSALAGGLYLFSTLGVAFVGLPLLLLPPCL
ncbi:hypothetical protein KG088_10280 [Halomonas sp. TRM85114]|uniref:hypothetical protein n=1 Tax=Halomonas jincaotanensis TaxID=2810616 RepID=UPI001BD2C106|nr:hypothetical protein [Halomonas jincaotanensis]MBS9404017.1 hypothetical protein [Halomonas jincaotanensis]